MKNKLLYAVLMFTILSYSQDDKVKKNQVKVNFLAPGIEYEMGLTDKTSLTFEVGSGFLYHYSSSFGSDFYLSPYLQSQYKYYYNFEKRKNKGKNTRNNSANYISVVGHLSPGYYSFADNEFVEIVGGFVGPAWGFQRTYNSGFNLSLDLGVGYGFNDEDGGSVVPIIGFQLGWVLDNKK